jgi:ABC-type sugar transport system ATPase subunit
MVGRSVEMERVSGERPAGGEVVLEVRGLSREGAFRDVSFDVCRGEILALAGLVGAGRTEVARAISGVDRPGAGEMKLRGGPYAPAGPGDAIARGVVYLPEERKTQGIVPGMTVGENVTLTALARFCRGGLVLRGREREAARGRVEALGVSPPDLDRPVATLSGGNQQKAVMARALLAEPEVLIVDEPTRGVDVGAKSEIHRRLRALADAGKAVLVISSELPEILALADRIIVMREGRVAGELAGARAGAREVMELALPRSHEAA